MAHLEYSRFVDLGDNCPSPRSVAAAGRSYPAPKARGGGQEEQPHVQGEVAARVQEGLEELSHVEDQEEQRLGDTLRPM